PTAISTIGHRLRTPRKNVRIAPNPPVMLPSRITAPTAMRMYGRTFDLRGLLESCVMMHRLRASLVVLHSTCFTRSRSLEALRPKAFTRRPSLDLVSLFDPALGAAYQVRYPRVTVRDQVLSDPTRASARAAYEHHRIGHLVDPRRDLGHGDVDRARHVPAFV